MYALMHLFGEVMCMTGAEKGVFGALEQRAGTVTGRAPFPCAHAAAAGMAG
ncbi:hypothetical protein D3C78_1744280 [compost metagenome]